MGARDRRRSRPTETQEEREGGPATAAWSGGCAGQALGYRTLHVVFADAGKAPAGRVAAAAALVMAVATVVARYRDVRLSPRAVARRTRRTEQGDDGRPGGGGNMRGAGVAGNHQRRRAREGDEISEPRGRRRDRRAA